MRASHSKTICLVTPVLALALAALPLSAQGRLPGSSWVEAGGL